MDQINLLLEEDFSFTTEERNTMLSVLSQVLFSKVDTQSKVIVEERLEILTQVIDFLTKVYYSYLSIDRKEKLALIQLIDKFKTQKELIELKSKDKKELGEFKEAQERFFKKTQSSAPNALLKSVELFLADALTDDEVVNFLAEFRNEPALFKNTLSNSNEFKEKTIKFLSRNKSIKVSNRLKIQNIEAEIQKQLEQ